MTLRSWLRRLTWLWRRTRIFASQDNWDSANSRSRCRKFMRPTENSNEATVCYKHCPDNCVGIDIPVTKISWLKHRTSWQPTPEPLPPLEWANSNEAASPKGSLAQTPQRRTPHQHVNFGQMLFDLQINWQTCWSIDKFSEYDQQCSNDPLALVSSSRPIKMSPRFVVGWENVPCVAEVVNRSLKADCTEVLKLSLHGALLYYIITPFHNYI